MKQLSRRISRLFLFVILLLMAASTGQPLLRAQDKVQVVWHPTYVAYENQEAAAQIVDDFNASQDEVELSVAIVNSTTSRDYVDMAAAVKGNTVVTGMELRTSKRWSWLDLAPLIESSEYDLSRYDPRVLDIYRQDGHLDGLPIVIYPLVLYYNRDLFDAAGVAYPPHGVGEAYADGDVWDMSKLKEIALHLTFDKQGLNALDRDFIPEMIEQYGYMHQWFGGFEHLMAPFGAGSLITDDGQTMLPDHWREGLAWYYDGWWTSHFIPTQAALDSEAFASNPFGSGHVAMATSGLWYACCITPETEVNWDMAMLPSYDGQVTSYLYENAVRILEGGPDPEASFTVAAYLIDRLAETPWAVSNGLPGQITAYERYPEAQAAQFPGQGIDWQVGIDSLQHALFSYDERTPGALSELDWEQPFLRRLQGTPDLDLDVEIETFLQALQAAFDSSALSTN